MRLQRRRVSPAFPKREFARVLQVLALRIGPQSDSTLTQKRLGRTATVLVASPGYLRRAGTPGSPDELAGHRCLLTPLNRPWGLHRDDGRRAQLLAVEPAVLVDDIGLVAMLVCDGHGIALLPVSEIVDRVAARSVAAGAAGLARAGSRYFRGLADGRLLSARARSLQAHIASHIAGLAALQGQVPQAHGCDSP